MKRCTGIGRVECEPGNHSLQHNSTFPYVIFRPLPPACCSKATRTHEVAFPVSSVIPIRCLILWLSAGGSGTWCSLVVLCSILVEGCLTGNSDPAISFIEPCHSPVTFHRGRLLLLDVCVFHYIWSWRETINNHQNVHIFYQSNCYNPSQNSTISQHL